MKTFLLGVLATTSLATAVDHHPQARQPDSSSLEGRAAACISFTSALTHDKGCCDPTTSSLFWIDQLLGLGICCALGDILDGLVCTAPPPPPKSSICSGEPVCPSKTGSDIGISYGHCYALLSLNDNYLGHDSATKYLVNGENPGVIFRVCANGDLATCAGSGSLVGVNDTWYMQDQFGDPDGTGFGWLSGTGGDLVVSDSASDAIPVAGRTSCYGGKCTICIRFPPHGAHAPCELPPGQSHLGIAANPNNCQPFVWEEVGCLSEL